MPDALPSSFSDSNRWPVLFLIAAWAAFFALRMSGPSDLMDNDQERPAAYMMDCARTGHWASQRDASGEVMSKPPLYTWLAAGVTLIIGRASLWGLYIPTGLAVLATVLLIYG
ncbi:glycosyltransferase family 39 protein, partial [bacterium]|nr:glycosyltransferase family 39 protein [bacterium]